MVIVKPDSVRRSCQRFNCRATWVVAI